MEKATALTSPSAGLNNFKTIAVLFSKLFYIFNKIYLKYVKSLNEYSSCLENSLREYVH